jgi:hypothetical protein
VGQLIDFYDVLSVRIVYGDIFQQEVAVHQDTAKRRIQLVRNLTG